MQQKKKATAIDFRRRSSAREAEGRRLSRPMWRTPMVPSWFIDFGLFLFVLSCQVGLMSYKHWSGEILLHHSLKCDVILLRYTFLPMKLREVSWCCVVDAVRLYLGHIWVFCAATLFCTVLANHFHLVLLPRWGRRVTLLFSCSVLSLVVQWRSRHQLYISRLHRLCFILCLPSFFFFFFARYKSSSKAPSQQSVSRDLHFF